MKAIYLESESKPPVFRDDLSPPQLRSGGAIVRMEAVPVLSYTRQVLNGSLNYVLPLPFIPGNSGVGVIAALADDVFHLRVGQRVSIDPRLTSHTAIRPDEADGILIGLTASTPESQKLQQLWRNGSYAEQALVPAECLTPLDALDGVSPARLSLLSHLAVPYGGLLRGDFRAGQSVVINGATGSFGARAVLVALAMGASRVFAVGRDKSVLKTLAERGGSRVVPIALGSDGREMNLRRLRDAVGGAGADLYFDMLGRAKDADSILVCLGALRHRGTAVFMGGVRIPVPLDYSEIMRKELSLFGNFMYPRPAVTDLVRLIKAGLLDLAQIDLQTFPLNEFESAMDAAERAKGLHAVSVTMDA